MNTNVSILSLPAELRLQVYECLYPNPPKPPQNIEPGSLGSGPSGITQNRSSSLRLLRKRNASGWTTLLLLCKQVHDEAEHAFYGSNIAKIGFYGISENATFFPKPPHCHSRTHFLGRYRDEDPLDKERYLRNLLKVNSLEVDIFVAGDERCAEHFWMIQDSLYDLISDLSKEQSKIRSLCVNINIVNFPYLVGPDLRQVSDWSPYTVLWPQMWEHSVFLLEPFQFLRGLDSAKLGTLSIWQFPNSQSEDIRGPWPDAGPQGKFKTHIERLMMDNEHTTGLWEMKHFYACLDILLRVRRGEDTWSRVYGDVAQMSSIGLQNVNSRIPKNSAEMEDWPVDFQFWLNTLSTAEACAKYFAVHLYQKMCAKKNDKTE